MKKNNNLSRSLVMLGLSTSLVLSGCFKGNKSEDASLKKVVDLEDALAIWADADTKYKIEDLYVYNEPCKNGTVLQRIYYKSKESLVNGKKYLFLQNFENSYTGTWICQDNIIHCENEWWLPDYRYSTITPLSNYLDILHIYLDRNFLNLMELNDLEKKLNNTNPLFNDNQRYSIENLLLLNVEGKYSLYSSENYLSYLSYDNLLIFYFFDVTDYKSALKLDMNITESEYYGEIIFGQNGNVNDYQVTSLDADYANSISNKDKKIELASWTRVRLEGISDNAFVEGLTKYFTPEQIQRGYITQNEAEEIIKSLNEQQLLDRRIDLY